MNREGAARAAEELGKSPAARWIGNKLVDGKLIQKCTRCGADQALEMPPTAVKAFQGGGAGTRSQLKYRPTSTPSSTRGSATSRSRTRAA